MAVVIASALCVSLSACEPQTDNGLRVIVNASKGARLAAARDGLIAFTDGAEASTAPASVGVDVRVVDRAGTEILNAPSAGGVRGLVLLPDAVATLELEASLADQRVVIRPFDGDPLSLEHDNLPLALGGVSEGLLWIEGRVADLEDLDARDAFLRQVWTAEQLTRR